MANRYIHDYIAVPVWANITTCLIFGEGFISALRLACGLHPCFQAESGLPPTAWLKSSEAVRRLDVCLQTIFLPAKHSDRPGKADSLQMVFH